MDLVSVITILGIVQGFYLAAVILTMKGPNQRANRFLSALLASYSFSITHFFFVRTGLYHTYPNLLQLSFPFLFLFGPLFYFYVRLLTDRSHSLRWRDLVHGAPFIIVILSQLPYYFLPLPQKLAYIDVVERQDVKPFELFATFVQIIQLACYLVASHLVLRNYERRIRTVRSSIERITLRWLQRAILLYIVAFGTIFILGALQTAGYEAMGIYYIFVPVFVTALIFAMGALGIKQPEIFVPSVQDDEKGEKYQRSALTPEKANEYLARLKHVMTQQKPHRDPELTLPGLASALDIPSHQLSQLLNETVGQSFFDFVNRERVEEAKQLLLDPAFQSYTILAIATEAGFNSKTAFNAAFKKHAGVTPSAFRTSRIPQ